MECEGMKKNIHLLIFISVLTLVGCGPKDQMTNFIPTPIPEEEQTVDVGVDSDTEEPSEAEDTNSEGDKETEEDTNSVGEDTTESSDAETIHVGETKTKYVKLNEYGGYVNVRSTPSKDGEIVGFLVHAEKISVIEIKDGWACFVQHNKKRYVSADFVVEERPAYLTPPTPTPIPTNTPKPKSTQTPEKEPTPTPDPNSAPPEI
jgi:hypothetical protein